MNEIYYSNLSSNANAVLKAAQSMDATVLITGATGTGKSHLAEKIHLNDKKRGAKKLIKVNLATLSETIIESELFGHEKGSFTGADMRRVGKLESADGGTVFLDEIGELPLRLQSKLLDFIQYKKITPVGSNKESKVDVRIIVATNRNLEVAVKANEFREDLFHRLNVFRVHIADLATMPQAALDLARDILKKKSDDAGKSISLIERDLQVAIRRYPWPGNIRELENAMEFAVAMENEQHLSLKSMPLGFQAWVQGRLGPECGEKERETETGGEEAAKEADPSSLKTIRNAVGVLELSVSLNYHESKEMFERTYIEYLLKSCNGQINLTSRRTGLNKVSLTDKIRRYGIDWRKIRFDSVNA